MLMQWWRMLETPTKPFKRCRREVQNKHDPLLVDVSKYVADIYVYYCLLNHNHTSYETQTLLIFNTCASILNILSLMFSEKLKKDGYAACCRFISWLLVKNS